MFGMNKSEEENMDNVTGLQQTPEENQEETPQEESAQEETPVEQTTEESEEEDSEDDSVVVTNNDIIATLEVPIKYEDKPIESILDDSHETLYHVQFSDNAHTTGHVPKEWLDKELAEAGEASEEQDDNA